MVVEKKKRYRSREQSRKQSKKRAQQIQPERGRERGGVSINRVAINSSVCMLSSINIPHRIHHTHPHHLITMRSRHHISHLQPHITNTEPHIIILPSICRIINSHTTTAAVHQPKAGEWSALRNPVKKNCRKSISSSVFDVVSKVCCVNLCLWQWHFRLIPIISTDV